MAEDLFETVIPRRIDDILTAEAARQHQREDAEAPPGADDVNFLIENEDILTAEAARQHQREDAEAPPGADDIKISPYMENLIKKGTDEDESAARAVLLPLQEQGRSC